MTGLTAAGGAIPVLHQLRIYWDWVGGNIGALPLEALITAAGAALGGWLLRKPLTRLAVWARGHLTSETHTALADMARELAAVKGAAEKARTSAAAAHRIAADTHQHLTGAEHPDAPGRGM